MDNIWIILLIVGAVISLSQKNREQHPQQEPEDEDPARELRKQFEEMFGQREKQPSAPRPTAKPASMPKASPTIPETGPHPVTSPCPATEIATSHSPGAPENRKPNMTGKLVRDTSHRNISTTQASARRQQQTMRPDTVPTAAALPAVDRHNESEIDRIIEEFDIERAVIYSEILKPKYEEY